MTEIKLKRNVKMKCYDVLMDVGIQQERPAYLAILNSIKETNGKGNPDYIANKLLAGRPKEAAINILRRCLELKLIDENWILTKDGEKAIENNRIFIPERGTYKLWITDELLLDQKILHFESIGNKANIGDIERSEIDLEEFDKLRIEIPLDILEKNMDTLSLFGSVRKAVKIIEIHKYGHKAELDSNNRLEIEINVKVDSTKPTISLSGKIGSSKEFMNILDITTILIFEYIWKELLGKEYTNWELYCRKLKVNFEDLDEEGKRTFKINRIFEKPRIGPYGVFDTTVVENISIKPIDFINAQKWFRWLLNNTNPGKYCWTTNYEDFIGKIKQKFPDYNDKLVSPNQETLAKIIKRDSFEKKKELSHSYWYFQAPIDLMLGGE